MATVTDRELAINWDFIGPLPPEAMDVLADPFADDDAPGLLAVETGAAAPCEPRLPLADALEVHAAYYRSLETPLGDWLAALISEKSSFARRHQAATLEQLDDRCAREELDYEDRLCVQARADGYDAAMRSLELEPVGYQHSAASVAALAEIRTGNAREAARLLRTYPAGGRAPLD